MELHEITQGLSKGIITKEQAAKLINQWLDFQVELGKIRDKIYKQDMARFPAGAQGLTPHA